MSKMLVVNFYGGPGVGKSTMACRVAGALMARGDTHTELVTEFAKDLVWDGATDALSPSSGCQLYVLGCQAQRLWRLERKGVQVAVTDSPLLLSAIYAGQDPAIHMAAHQEMRKYDNMDFVLQRKTKYRDNGRVHTEAAAEYIDTLITDHLSECGIEYVSVVPTYLTALDFILSLILLRIKV